MNQESSATKIPLKASGEEFGAGIKHAVERGWIELHESGIYMRLTKTEAAN